MSIRYNERSWAIDVISEINLLCSRMGRAVRRAGGESTLKNEGGVLFPDVLLFGDDSRIVQGWELKMPDTPITDNELLNNAERKARLLGLNSFLVWNVTNAALYVLEQASGRFLPVRHWEITIRNREEVINRWREWRQLLERIIADINDFLEIGTIFSANFHEVFDRNTIVDVILGHKQGVGELLRRTAGANATTRAEINNWWRLCHSEYFIDEPDQWNALAKVNLLQWLNRLLFAQWMKRFFTAAREIDRITPGTNVEEASLIISNITRQCDFLNIFQPMICSQVLTDAAWQELTELNAFLTDIRLENVSQDILQNILEKVVYSARRELVGQYATPSILADLLVNMTVDDWGDDVIDPCCGTGTIAKAIFDNKRRYLESSAMALAST
ncbi:MAG: SAM-dependent DNA methyltransferase, partial [Negativicutes bacterium]|nr:SAM-dependent DNA methyltransferase [Negativicutes bacterium]